MSTYQDSIREIILAIKKENEELINIKNKDILLSLREVIYHLEYRNASRQNLMKEFWQEIQETSWVKCYEGIENILSCKECGYFVCNHE